MQCLNNIGSSYDAQKDYKQALIFYEKSLKLKKSTIGDHNPDYLLTLSNIGKTYFNLKQF